MPDPDVDLPTAVDVAIVGGGFAGVATAWWLARRGVTDVVVIEREASLGRHASGRGAGLGRQLADDDATTALTVRGAAFLRRPPPGFGAGGDAVWSPTGGVLSFDDGAHARVYAERARRFGVATKPVERAELVERWPALRGLATATAWLVPSDGVIGLDALLAAYASGAADLGVRFARSTEVLAVEASGAGAGATLATRRGPLTARVVVDAGGAWAGGLTADPALTALQRHVFVLASAAPAADAPYVWHLGKDEMYVRATTGGASVLTSVCDALPATAGEPRFDDGALAELRRVLAVAAPELARADVERSWACLRSFAADRRMRLGRDPRRAWLVWAAALGGHGATSSAAVGEVVATAVLDALAQTS